MQGWRCGGEKAPGREELVQIRVERDSPRKLRVWPKPGAVGGAERGEGPGLKAAAVSRRRPRQAESLARCSPQTSDSPRGNHFQLFC